MKTVGIIGGIGPLATIEYYRKIVSSYTERTDNKEYPQIIINSINLTNMLNLMNEERYEEVVDYLAFELQKLVDAKTDFAVFASNTPHLVFDDIQKKSTLPLISIVEATCQKASEHNLQKVLLLGTKFTMQGGFYDKVFAEKDIDVIVPDENDQDFIHDKYMNELLVGIFTDETKQSLLKIVDKLKSEKGIQGVILGGTEIPFILKEEDFEDLRVLDTTKIHVESVVEKLM